VTRSITIRNVHFELGEEIPRYWYDGDPARTHLMNALSSTFPAGEAFFVRSVQHYRDQIDDPALLEQIKRFVGQEAVHSREHDAHVKLLVAQGYPGIARINKQADREMRWWNRRAPRFSLATTAALEHLTAIMARRALSEPDYWAGPMHEHMAPLWQWHAMEEAEHKAVAFDVLERVSGSYRLRVLAMLFASFGLLLDNLVRWAYLMFKDGRLLEPKMWSGTFRFLWARGGLYRALIPDYVRWYRRDFHPWQQDDQPLIDACRERLALEIA
jgi:predicted metal-dependent hydrolase